MSVLGIWGELFIHSNKKALETNHSLKQYLFLHFKQIFRFFFLGGGAQSSQKLSHFRLKSDFFAFFVLANFRSLIQQIGFSISWFSSS